MTYQEYNSFVQGHRAKTTRRKSFFLCVCVCVFGLNNNSRKRNGFVCVCVCVWFLFVRSSSVMVGLIFTELTLELFVGFGAVKSFNHYLQRLYHLELLFLNKHFYCRKISSKYQLGKVCSTKLVLG
jgi:hypothetical protein